MSWFSKIVWSDGLFLRPQHFQQHDRYIEGYVEQRCQYLLPYPWGFVTLGCDAKLLPLGKSGVTSAKGVMPDGTPFSFPEQDLPPDPLQVPETTRNEIIYLVLPVRRAGAPESNVGATANDARLFRHAANEYDVIDANGGASDAAAIQIGQLKFRLMRESEDRSNYSCLGIARILEVRAEQGIVLDDAYVPPCLTVGANARLCGFITELQGLLNNRGEALAARVTGASRGAVADIADFLLLQTVNRLEPLFTHLTNVKALDPEALFRICVAAAGELSTFTRLEKRPVIFPAYNHEALAGCFGLVMSELRRSLTTVLEQTAIALELQEKPYGVRVAPKADNALLEDAVFVLAASADMSGELLRKQFPAQTKIGPVEAIRQLVNFALPGIGLEPLPVAPRQIPYHAGFTYFELSRGSNLWKELTKSAAFAIHVGGEFPSLQLEFWAIRS